MDKQEIIEQIKELKQRIERLEEEVKPDELNVDLTGVRWQPILGQLYYYLDDFGEIISAEWDYDDILVK